jgi:hypothetical protein
MGHPEKRQETNRHPYPDLSTKHGCIGHCWPLLVHHRARDKGKTAQQSHRVRRSHSDRAVLPAIPNAIQVPARLGWRFAWMASALDVFVDDVFCVFARSECDSQTKISCGESSITNPTAFRRLDARQVLDEDGQLLVIAITSKSPLPLRRGQWLSHLLNSHRVPRNLFRVHQM